MVMYIRTYIHGYMQMQIEQRSQCHIVSIRAIRCDYFSSLSL
jgi:hypothetical protein